MDFLFRNISDNYNKMRKSRISSPNLQFSKTFSMSSTKLLVIYYKRMEMNNNLENNIEIELINSSQLLYVISKGQVNQVSTVANSNNNIKDQHVPIEGPVLNLSSPSYIDNDNVINIQLPYDPNRPTEPDL